MPVYDNYVFEWEWIIDPINNEEYFAPPRVDDPSLRPAAWVDLRAGVAQTMGGYGYGAYPAGSPPIGGSSYLVDTGDPVLTTISPAEANQWNSRVGFKPDAGVTIAQAVFDNMTVGGSGDGTTGPYPLKVAPRDQRFHCKMWDSIAHAPIFDISEQFSVALPYWPQVQQHYRRTFSLLWDGISHIIARRWLWAQEWGLAPPGAPPYPLPFDWHLLVDPSLWPQVESEGGPEEHTSYIEDTYSDDPGVYLRAHTPTPTDQPNNAWMWQDDYYGQSQVIYNIGAAGDTLVIGAGGQAARYARADFDLGSDDNEVSSRIKVYDGRNGLANRIDPSTFWTFYHYRPNSSTNAALSAIYKFIDNVATLLGSDTYPSSLWGDEITMIGKANGDSIEMWAGFPSAEDELLIGSTDTGITGFPYAGYRGFENNSEWYDFRSETELAGIPVGLKAAEARRRRIF